MRGMRATTRQPFTVIRRGPRQWRVQLDGQTATTLLDAGECVIVPTYANPARIPPVTPLRRLYDRLRTLTGSRSEKFDALRRQLGGLGEFEPAAFLAELFARSVALADFYDNREEPFVPEARGPLADQGVQFARRFRLAAITNSSEFVQPHDDELFYRYIDHELSPFRTTGACWEDGDAADASGHGGIDLLLCAYDELIPMVCEVKAATETVGESFALIQCLTYLAEMATANQWERLTRSYELEELYNAGVPCFDACLILEAKGPRDETDNVDREFMRMLALGVANSPTGKRVIRRIVVYDTTMRNSTAVLDCTFRSDRT